MAQNWQWQLKNGNKLSLSLKKKPRTINKELLTRAIKKQATTQAVALVSVLVVNNSLVNYLFMFKLEKYIRILSAYQHNHWRDIGVILA